MAISIPYSGYVSKLLNFVHLGLKFEQAWPLWGVGGLLLGLAGRVWPGWVGVAIIAWLGLGIAAYGLWPRRRLGLGGLLLVALCSGLGGYLQAPALGVESWAEGWLAAREYAALEGRGRVLEARPLPWGTQLLLSFPAPRAGRPELTLVASGPLTLANLRPGDLLACEGRLYPLGEEAKYYRPHSVSHSLKLGAWRLVERAPPPTPSWGERVNCTLVEQAQRKWQGAQRGLILGVLLGRSAHLDPESKRLFRRVGLSHLTAASGFNVAIVAAGAIFILRALGFSQRGAAGGGMLSITLYLLIVGFTPSLVRAWVMGLFYLGSRPLGRPSSAKRAWLLALWLLLLIKPSWLGDVGWQLSFGAVAALLWVAPWGAQLGWRSAGARAVAATLAVTLFLAPLLINHFQSIPSATLGANLTVAPLVELLFIGGWAALGWGETPGVGPLLIGCADLLATAVLVGASLWDKFCPLWSCLPLSGGQLALYYLVLGVGVLVMEGLARDLEDSQGGKRSLA